MTVLTSSSPMAPSHPPNTPSPHSPITSHWPHPNFPTSIFFLPPATIRPQGADIHNSSIIIHHSEMPAGLLFTTHSSPLTKHSSFITPKCPQGTIPSPQHPIPPFPQYFFKKWLIFFSMCVKNKSYPGKPAMLKISKPGSESRKGVRSGSRGGSL